MAAGVAPGEGVKLMNVAPKSKAAMAYSELAESGHLRGWSSSFIELRPALGNCFSTSIGGSVEATIDDDQMGQLLLAARTTAYRPCSRSDGFARRFALRSDGRLGEFRDRRADVVDRAGTEILFDPVQLAFALQQNVFRDGPAFGVHPHRFVEQPAAADIVPTDDEVFPIEQIERCELRQQRLPARFRPSNLFSTPRGP